MKIYVGNLAYEVTEDELRKEFAAFGEVTSVSLPTDSTAGAPGDLASLKWPIKPRVTLLLLALTARC